MSSTKFWFTPSGYIGTGTVSGSTDSNVSVTATSLTIPGGYELSDYTFPGAGTLVATTGRITVTANVLTTWQLTSTSPNSRKVITFQSDINGASQEILQVVQDGDGEPYNRVISVGVPEYYTSGNTTVLIRGSGTTEGSANTVPGVAYTGGSVSSFVKYSGSDPSPSINMDFEHDVQYHYSVQYEADFHSIDGADGDTPPQITLDATFAPTLGGLVVSISADLDFESTATATATNLTGLRFVSRGGGVYEREAGSTYFLEGAASSELYFVEGYTAEGYVAINTAYVESDYIEDTFEVIQLTPGVPIEQIYSQDSVAEYTAGLLQVLTPATHAVDTTLGALGGLAQQISSAASTDTETSVGLVNLLPPGTATSSIDSEFTATAQVNISGGTNQDTVMVLSGDADMFRGGTATFDAVANIPLAQIGFAVAASVGYSADSELEFSPSVGTVAGIRFNIDETLDGVTDYPPHVFYVHADYTDLGYAELSNITAVLISAATVDCNIDTQFADTDPSVLQPIEPFGTSVDSTCTADGILRVGIASNTSAELDIILAQAGYLLSADIQITQEITSTFDNTVARLFRVDEYFLNLIVPETRTLQVLAESRELELEPETRINTVLEESTDLTVTRETRIMPVPRIPTELQGNRLKRIPQ